MLRTARPSDPALPAAWTFCAALSSRSPLWSIHHDETDRTETADPPPSRVLPTRRRRGPGRRTRVHAAAANGTPTAPCDPDEKLLDGDPDAKLTPAQRLAKHKELALLLVQFRQLDFALASLEDAVDNAPDDAENEDAHAFRNDLWHVQLQISMIADSISAETMFPLCQTAEAEAKRLRQEFAGGLVYHACPAWWALKSFYATEAALIDVRDRQEKDSNLRRDSNCWLWSLQLYEGVCYGEAHSYFNATAKAEFWKGLAPRRAGAV